MLLFAGTIPLAHADAPSGTTLDSVTTDRSNGTADGTFANGWKWEFHFTVPMGETSFKMKFSNFTHGSDTVSASSVRIFSAQSDHSSEEGAISITGADTFSDPMILSGDLDGETSGRQIVVVVEVAVPSGTPGGAYSATYDIESKDVTPPVITLIGETTVGLFTGGTYTEQGATAIDNLDPAVSVVIGGDTVSTLVPAVFHITYDAMDAAGNSAVQVVRTVNVILSVPLPICPPICID